ncbi:hypothetical protein WMF18_06705 [Sorangium sp. So ce315]|uniref:hypothetical protein n=1 Tax=Sorangium sp. So ce315 TaxID=3133299 RepID=UPI003F607188
MPAPPLPSEPPPDVEPADVELADVELADVELADVELADVEPVVELLLVEAPEDPPAPGSTESGSDEQADSAAATLTVKSTLRFNAVRLIATPPRWLLIAAAPLVPA